MGFFDRIFGKEKEEEIKEKYSLESAEKMLKEKIDERQRQIEPELKDFHKRLLELDSQLRESLKKLDSAVPKEKMDEKLLFAAVTGRKTFRNKISKVSEAIKKDVGFDFHSFSEYYNDCVFAVNQANALAITEFRSIGIVFKEEGNEVVDNLRKLKDYLSGVGSRIKEQQKEINPYDAVLEKTLELEKLVGKLGEDKKRIQEFKNEIETKSVSLTGFRKSVEELTNSNEWKEYENGLKTKKDLDTREAEIRAQFNEMISSVERPIRKAIRIVDEVQEENKFRKVFAGYSENPFETFLKDGKNEALTNLLSLTKKFLEERKIDVNENVREKSIGKIDGWTSENIFEKIKTDYENVIKEIGETEVENRLAIQKSDLQRKIGMNEEEIVEMKKKIELTEKHVEENKKLAEEMRKGVGDEIGELLNHHCELGINY